MLRLGHGDGPGVIGRACAFLAGLTPKGDYTPLSCAPRPVSNPAVLRFRNVPCLSKSARHLRGNCLKNGGRRDIGVFAPALRCDALQGRKTYAKIRLCKKL